MTTSHAPPSLNLRKSDGSRTTRWRFGLSVLALSATLFAFSLAGWGADIRSDRLTESIQLGAMDQPLAGLEPQRSALLVQARFEAIIDNALAAIEPQPSALLDQTRFAAAIDQALAAIEPQPSALLDQARFAAAIDRALAQIES